ncbi:MAG: DUF3696 domain-containing protein [Algoriphagus sp.]|nr:DUF3696 domain-containing protein [Algoriphagus sp.]
MPYLHTIGLENFRLFKERTTFELAPITILTGINNSGKSSLIKSLQLFKSSIKATGGLDELNFTGGRHNLGSFKTSLNRNAESGEMKFKFDFPLPSIREKTFLELSYKAEKGNPEFGQLVSFRIVLESGQFLIKGELGDETENEKLLFFDFEFLNNYFSKIFTPTFFSKREEDEEFWKDPTKAEEFWKSLSSDSVGATSAAIREAQESSIFNYFYTPKQLNYSFNYENDKCYNIFKGFENFREEVKEHCLNILWKLKNEGFPISISFLDISNNAFLKEEIRSIRMNLEWYSERSNEPKYQISSIMNFILEDFFNKEVLNKLNDFAKYFDSISSLSSVRANSERLYSNTSDVVDINSLLIDFSRLTFTKHDPIKEFINRSLQRFSIGEEIVINRYQGRATEIFIKREGQTVLLADLGFGFTQLVPIILKIAVSAKRKQSDDLLYPFSSSLFLLEEPESNLHPSYQSKLAELIIDAAISFDIQFIIETHSEYLIRNLQYLTATKKLKSGDSKIYYFHQPGTEDFEESPYRVIDIMKDGRLSNEFGEGFFDEIPRLLAFLYNSSYN